MTIEELYLKEKDRIKKLSLHYARMYKAEREDLLQEGYLALLETYAKYYTLPGEELLKVSHRVINRMMYRYAQNEYRYKTTSSFESYDTTEMNK